LRLQFSQDSCIRFFFKGLGQLGEVICETLNPKTSLKNSWQLRSMFSYPGSEHQAPEDVKVVAANHPANFPDSPNNSRRTWPSTRPPRPLGLTFLGSLDSKTSALIAK